MNAAVAPRPFFLNRQHLFLAALAVFFFALTIQYVLKIQHSDRENRSAFLRWRNQLLELREGVNVWEKHNYPNPPIMALVLLPFTYLPPLAGSVVFFYAKVLMAILAIHWVCRMLDRPERPFPFWGQALATLLSLRAIQGDLIHGNVNLIILFLTVASLFAFTRRRDISGGLLLALAIACKITPALFVPYFLWKRAWTMAAASLVGLALFLCVVPALFFGWSNNLLYLESWKKVMFEPFVVKGEVWCEHNNQSLPGLAARLLSHQPSFTDWVKDDEGRDVKTPVEYHNLLALDHQTVGWIVKGCIGVFGLLVLWKCRTPIQERTNWRLLAEFSIVILGMLLFSERTWKHHCVTLLVPFAVLAYYVSAHWRERGGRWLSMGAMAAATLLMTLTSTGLSEDQDRLGKLAQVFGAYTWCFVLLTGSMAYLLGRPKLAGGAVVLPLNKLERALKKAG
jgi:hypothetical protein